MTREEAIQCIKHELLINVNRKDLTGQAIGEALDMAIEALKANPKKGIWIPVTRVYTTTENYFPYTRCEYIDATEPDEIDAVRCSECGEVFDFYDARNYCPNCGADMKGEE